MIIDYIEHYEKYAKVVPNFLEGMQFALNLQDKPAGRYEQGDIYAMVQEGVTEAIADGNFERHEKYIDVQIMLEGEEIIEWEDTNNLEECIPYMEDKDAGFCRGSGQKIHIKKGMFYLMFPHDAHKPCKHEKVPTIYKKIVLKLQVNNKST